ncbi:MAG: hypothetical protein H0V88_00580 [Pyrinomonadaceae bacterium]|nr:hypothetical protein [Pyrinomonadaceae bacterium]
MTVNKLCFALLLCALATVSPAVAQNRAAARKLPAPERIVDDYLKAIGGKKRVGNMRDASYEWNIELNNQPYGRARASLKAPSSARVDLIFGNGETTYAATSRSVWSRGIDGATSTLTGAEASRARLLATLTASRLINFRKQNLLARTVALEAREGEQSFIVEFTARDNSRVRYEFDQKSKLLTRITDDAGNWLARLSDYRAESGLLEPHRVEVNLSGTGALVMNLQTVRRNANISETAFEPPRGAELDVATLLREVARNQSIVDERVNQYSFKQKQTERTLNNRGEVTKENVRIYEVYPLPGRRPAFKLISENGRLLSPERRAREEKRVTEELEEAERNREKDKQKREARDTKRAQATDDAKMQEDDEQDARQFTSILLRACELVSPRRERFRDRDSVVFDFRPREGFRPANRVESLVSKLGGIMWIDPVDKQVIRFEARLVEGFKVGGGLFASVRPGTALVVEQTRLPDGVWLPRLAQFNASIRILLLGGGDFNVTQEWSDYRRFNVEAGDAIINAPKDN